MPARANASRSASASASATLVGGTIGETPSSESAVLANLGWVLNTGLARALPRETADPFEPLDYSISDTDGDDGAPQRTCQSSSTCRNRPEIKCRGRCVGSTECSRDES